MTRETAITIATEFLFSALEEMNSKIQAHIKKHNVVEAQDLIEYCSLNELIDFLFEILPELDNVSREFETLKKYGH